MPESNVCSIVPRWPPSPCSRSRGGGSTRRSSAGWSSSRPSARRSSTPSPATTCRSTGRSTRTEVAPMPAVLRRGTPSSSADGRPKPLANDRRSATSIYRHRTDAATTVATCRLPVLAHWETIKPGYRVTLEDGTDARRQRRSPLPHRPSRLEARRTCRPRTRSADHTSRPTTSFSVSAGSPLRPDRGRGIPAGVPADRDDPWRRPSSGPIDTVRPVQAGTATSIRFRLALDRRGGFGSNRVPISRLFRRSRRGASLFQAATTTHKALSAIPTARAR